MNLTDHTVKKIKELILFTVIVVLIAWNWSLCLGLLLSGLRLLMPFIIGACMAYVLNIPMRWIEAHLKLKNEKLGRALSLICTLLLVIIVLFAVTVLVIPQVGASVISLQYKIPGFLYESERWIEALMKNYPELADLLNSSAADWDAVFAKAQALLTQSALSILNGSVSAARGLVSVLTDFFIGLIFAIYLMVGKEKLLGQVKHLMAAFLKKEQCDLITGIAVLADKRFSSFIAGQCLEACILGSMFFVTMSLIRLPYAVLIGVLIAVTALIPVFGAFVGLFVGCFLMLIQSPAYALIFAVMFFVLQQIEGNLIYPHVVGGSVELPAIWVLVAVTVGGSAFGVVGMIVFIPLFSVFYSLLRGIVRARLCGKPNENLKDIQDTVKAIEK